MNASNAAAMSDEDRKLVQFLAKVGVDQVIDLGGEVWISTRDQIEDDAATAHELAAQDDEEVASIWETDFSRAPYWIYSGFQLELGAAPIRDISDLREYLERRGIEVDDLRV